MYVYDKAKTPVDKKHNKETLDLAENIKAKRQLEIQQEDFGFISTTKKKADFIAYFASLADKRSGTNSDNWASALNYLKDFAGGRIKFADINEVWMEDFKVYLKTSKSRRSTKSNLSQNSMVSYFIGGS